MSSCDNSLLEENIKKDSYLDTIVNNLPHFIFWKDLKCKFLGCNKKFSDSVGLASPTDIIGKTDYDMPWSQEQSDAYIHDDKIIIETGVAKLDYEENQKQIDGSEKIMLVSKVPMFDKEGRITGVLGIYSDITDRKQMEAELMITKERAEVANKAKSEFLAVVSHELRIPLTGILGMIEILKSENLTAKEKQQYVDYLDKSGQHLFSLINNVLDFAKLEAGRFEVVNASINLKEIIDEVVNMLTGAAKAKGLMLGYEYQSGTPYLVNGDGWSLKRILVNLINNAIKFTERGHVRINVLCEKQNKYSAIFKMSVEDSGLGIPADKLNLIFDHFQQVSPVYTRNSSQVGTGLGLSITKKLVEMMGGELSVSSEMGKGSIFTCQIPLKLQRSIAEEVTTRSNKYETSQNDPKINFAQGNMPSVLLVEDDLIVRVIHEKYIKKLGVKLVVAENGYSALALAQQKFDLILMDVGLPEINGFEVTKMIRQNDQQVFIVGLTGYSDYETYEKCLLSGMNEVLVKPVQLDDLARIIKLVESKK